MPQISLLKKHKEPIEEPTINLTPLIDVVFVILIIFIVIAPLLEIDQIALAEAGKQSDAKVCLTTEKCGPLSFHVKADNSIWFNEKKLEANELPLVLANAKLQFPEATPQLFHDRHAQFGTYQSIKNATEEAGFKQLDIILSPH